jgi:NlpC/P60 family putative phage cell wall peptidase
MSNDVVIAARKWLGTPYQHQGRLLGVGVDCIGVCIKVAHELGLSEFDTADYAASPDGVSLQAMADAHMDRIPFDDATVGDWLLLKWKAHPQHFALLTDIGVLHAYAGAERVIETVLTPSWIRKIVCAYRYRRNG